MAIAKQLELEEDSDDEITYVIPLKEEAISSEFPSQPALSISSESETGDERLDTIELGYALAKHELPDCDQFALILVHLNQNIEPKLNREERAYLRELFDKDHKPAAPFGINRGLNQQQYGMNNCFGMPNGMQQQGYGMNNGFQQQNFGMGMQDNFNFEVQKMEREWEKQRRDEERQRMQEQQKEQHRIREDERMRRLEDMLFQAQLRQQQQQQPSQQTWWQNVPPWMVFGARENDNHEKDLKRLGREIKDLQRLLKEQSEQRDRDYEPSWYYYETKPPAVSPTASETFFTEADGTAYTETLYTEEMAPTSPTGVDQDTEGMYTETTLPPPPAETVSDAETEKVPAGGVRDCLKRHNYLLLLPALAVYYYFTYDAWNGTTGSLTDVEIPFGYCISSGVFLTVMTFLATFMLVFVTCQRSSFVAGDSPFEYRKKDYIMSMSSCYLIFVVASSLWIFKNPFLSNPLNKIHWNNRFAPLHQPFTIEYAELFEPSSLAELTSAITNPYLRIREDLGGHVDAPMMDSRVLLNMNGFNSIFTVVDGTGNLLVDGGGVDDLSAFKELDSRRRLENLNETTVNSTNVAISNNSSTLGNGTSGGEAVNSTIVTTSVPTGAATSEPSATFEDPTVFEEPFTSENTVTSEEPSTYEELVSSTTELNEESTTVPAAPFSVMNDTSRFFATFGVGVKIYEAAEFLYEQNLMLKGAPIFPDITIGEAISVGMSGRGFAPLSDYVHIIDYFSHTGLPRTISEASDPDSMRAFRVSLGLLGVIYKVTIEVFPLRFVERSFEELRSELTQSDIEQYLNRTDSIVNQQIKISPLSGTGVYEYHEITARDAKATLEEGWYKQTARPRTLWYYVGLPAFVVSHFRMFKTKIIDSFLSDFILTEPDPSKVPMFASIPWSDFVGFEHNEVYVPLERCGEAYGVIQSLAQENVYVTEIVISRIDPLKSTILGLQSTSCKIEFSLLLPHSATYDNIHSEINGLGGYSGFRYKHPGYEVEMWSEFSNYVAKFDPGGRFYSKYLYDMLGIDVPELLTGNYDVSPAFEGGEKLKRFHLLRNIALGGLVAVFIIYDTVILMYSKSSAWEDDYEKSVWEDTASESFTEKTPSLTLYE